MKAKPVPLAVVERLKLESRFERPTMSAGEVDWPGWCCGSLMRQLEDLRALLERCRCRRHANRNRPVNRRASVAATSIDNNRSNAAVIDSSSAAAWFEDRRQRFGRIGEFENPEMPTQALVETRSFGGVRCG